MARHIGDSELYRAQTGPTQSKVVADFPAAVDGVHTIPICKAAELKISGTEGYIEVHLINDPDNKFYAMPLYPGDRNSGVFDKVKVTSSVAPALNLSDIVFFPLEAN